MCVELWVTLSETFQQLDFPEHIQNVPTYICSLSIFGFFMLLFVWPSNYVLALAFCSINKLYVILYGDIDMIYLWSYLCRIIYCEIDSVSRERDKLLLLLLSMRFYTLSQMLYKFIVYFSRVVYQMCSFYRY